MSDEKMMVKCNQCKGHRSILSVGDKMHCHNCGGTDVSPQGEGYYFLWPRDAWGPFKRFTQVVDSALTPFSDKPDVTLKLRAAELSFLIYLLERGSMSARAHMESGSSNYALVCDRLLRKLTDLEGTTEERFDRAVAEIVKRG